MANLLRYVCSLGCLFAFHLPQIRSQNTQELEDALKLMDKLGRDFANMTSLPEQLKQLFDMLIKMKEDSDKVLLNFMESLAPLANVTSACKTSVRNMMMSGDPTPIIVMLDALGKPRAGVFEGNTAFLGSYGECVAVEGDGFKGRHCVASLINYNLAFIPLPSVKWGICVPDTCTTADFHQLVIIILTLLNKQEEQFEFAPYAPKCDLPLSELDSPNALTIFMSCLLSLIVALVISGTIYDVVIEQPRLEQIENDKKMGVYSTNDTENPNKAQIEPEEQKPRAPPQPSLPAKIILCFSVYTNTIKLINLDRTPGSLDCVHGVRVLSLTWVYLGHSLVTVLPVGANTINFIQSSLQNWTFQGLSKASLSVDTFLVMSGMLLTYLFFKEMHKLQFNLRRFNWPMYYIHRYIRLTPPYFLVLGTYLAFFKYAVHGPFANQEFSMDEENCKKSWWYNLLYINNFYHPSAASCMGWTWYLANDMQFYVISPIFLIAFVLLWPVGLGLSVAMVIGSMIATGVLEKENPYGFGLGGIAPEAFQNIYVKPYCRMGAYFIGIMLGYVLFKTKLKARLPMAAAIGGWVIAAASALAVVYGTFNRDKQIVFGKEIYSSNTMAFYAAMSRNIWSLAVAWVIFACLNGYGGIINRFLSWKIFLPFSRITYAGYLVHPVIMNFVGQNQKDSVKFDTLTLVIWFLAMSVMSYAAAFVLTLVFESPIIGLEKVLMRRRR